MSQKQGLLLTLILTTIVGSALLYAWKIKNSNSDVTRYLEFTQKMDAEKEESGHSFDSPIDWETPQVYRNDRFGFQFTVTDAWRGYRVRQADVAMLSLIDNAVGFNLEIPTKDSSYTKANYQHSAGYAPVLSIYMYTKPVWQTLQSGEEGPAGGTYITGDDYHVFTYFDWHSDPPFDLQSVDFEISKVISTFSLFEKERVDTSNRRTYINTKYGYSIKYPANWYVDTTASEKDLELRVPEREETLGGDTYFSDFPDVWQYNPSNPLIVDHFEISLLVYKIDPRMTYAQFLKKHFDYLSPTAMESIKINGVPAMRVIMVTTDHPVGVTVVGVFIKSGDRIFVFSYSGKPITQANRDTANRIIGSFQLSEKNDVSQ